MKSATSLGSRGNSGIAGYPVTIPSASSPQVFRPDSAGAASGTAEPAGSDFGR
jgi:hypothetical protein